MLKIVGFYGCRQLDSPPLVPGFQAGLSDESRYQAGRITSVTTTSFRVWRCHVGNQIRDSLFFQEDVAKGSQISIRDAAINLDDLPRDKRGPLIE